MSASTSKWAHEPYLAALGTAAKQCENRLDRDCALVCRVGFHMECAVLKVQKAEWTNDDLTTMRNQTGVFFTIWVADEGARTGRVDYNIHSLRLRKLVGHRLTSKAFASAFRAEFMKSAGDWPNVRTNFGPLTLMQGHASSNIKTRAARSVDLIQKFRPLSAVVDQPFAAHRR